MCRAFGVFGALALSAALALAGGCGSTGGGDEARLRLFDRIALEIVKYNDALGVQDDVTVAMIASQISRLVDSHFEDVAAGLAGEDPVRQGEAAFALGFSKKPEAAGPLLQAVKSPVMAVRANAAASLGMLASEAVPEQPFRDLLKDPEPPVRQAALFGLRLLLSEGRDRGLLEAVHEKLADPVMDVRNDALILLRKLKKKESVAAILERSMKDPDPLVRSNAAAALGAMGSKALEATPALIELLRDDVPKVVESTWVALKAIHQKDLDRSYGSWRGWYDEEVQHLYVCLDHPEVSQTSPGECPQCKVKLERIPVEAVKKTQVSSGPFACPSHPEVLTQTAGKCGRAGCGKDLVPRKPEPVLYACPDHPEIQTMTPARCGKPGCGKELAPRGPLPEIYACPTHPEVQTATPGKCGKPDCGKDLLPKK